MGAKNINKSMCNAVDFNRQRARKKCLDEGLRWLKGEEERKWEEKKREKEREREERK